MSARSSRLKAPLSVLALALAVPAAASAQSAQWMATSVSQSGPATLESGERLTGQTIVLKNAGTGTWISPDVRLATGSPRGRLSQFGDPSWINGTRTRIVPVSEQSVAPGQNGRFVFAITAPGVTTQTTFREGFEAVYERVSWLGQIDTIEYTVLPSLPPTVSVTRFPQQVQRGSDINVAAEANDNRAVSGVTFRIGEQRVGGTLSDDRRTWSATLSSRELPSGPHTVVAQASDRVGNVASDNASVQVVEPAPAPGATPPPAGAPGAAPPAAGLKRISGLSIIFSTRADSRRRQIGVLDGVRVRGAPSRARVRVVCVARCSRSFVTARTSDSAGRSTLRPRRAFRVTSRTRVDIQVSAPGFATRFNRYRFVKRGTGRKREAIGVFVASGCLAAPASRRVVRCP